MKVLQPVPQKKPVVWVIRILFLGCLLLALYFILVGIYWLLPVPHPHQKFGTLAVCAELEQAIQRFYDDNGTLPADVVEDTTFSSSSEQGVEMLLVLINQESNGSPLNRKGVKYLNVKQGDHKRDGLIFNDVGTEVLGLYDPWGGSYMIALDGDFDEEITVQPKAQREPRVLRRRVAVWSNGKDPEHPKDDVTTW